MTKHEITNWDVTSGSRERQLPAIVSESVVVSNLRRRPTRVKNDDHLRHLWNEILDRQLTELSSRFQGDHYGIMKAAAACHPLSRTFDMELLRPTCQHYGINIGDAKLTVFTRQVHRKVYLDRKGQKFASLVDVTDSCSQDIFPNINKLLWIIMTLSMTSCTAEHVFFISGRIQSSLRSSMGTASLRHLAILSHKLTETIDYDKVIEVKTLKSCAVSEDNTKKVS